MEYNSTIRNTNMKNDVSGIKVFRRGLRLLERLAEADQGIGVLELAQQLDLPASTMHRILRTFQQEGYVRQDEAKRYGLSTKILALARRFLQGIDLRDVAIPHLQGLRDNIGETTYLAIRDGCEAVPLEVFCSPSNVRVMALVGERWPLNSTAVGKVLLSAASDEELAALVTQTAPKKLTPHTLTSLRQLKAETERIRKDGYALDDQEYLLGVRCVAAPIVDGNGAVVAAIGIAAPVFRIEGPRIEVVAHAVQDAAAAVSAALRGASTTVRKQNPCIRAGKTKTTR
jgi:DNA-binding IclR family transcriptional regulator